jgi:diacylglycerol kinase (ATP)
MYSITSAQKYDLIFGKILFSDQQTEYMKDQLPYSDKRSWWIIANPTAQSNTCRKKLPGYLNAWKAVGLEFILKQTEYEGHAGALAIEGIQKGYRFILIVGGDGTLHEAVNGILRQALVPANEIYIAIVPLGTANDWARFYKFPTEYKAVNKMLQSGKMKVQDAGKLFFPQTGKTHFFINVFGAGYDGYVARQLQSGEKKKWGKASYLLTVAKGLFKYKASETIVSDHEGKTWRQDAFFSVNAGITTFSGNGMRIVPHARPDDGLLGVTLIRQMPVWRLAANLYRLFSGTLIHHPLVDHGQQASITLDFAPSGAAIDVEADGEWLGVSPVMVTCLPNAIGIVLPE